MGGAHPPSISLNSERRHPGSPTYPHRLHTAVPMAVRSACGAVFSFEATLIMMLFAGIYKDEPYLEWLPVDITAAFFVVSVLTGLYLVWRRGIALVRYSALIIWLYGALATWALISTLWSPSLVYAQDKALFLCTLEFWPLAAGALIIAPEPARYRRFFLLLLLFSGWVALQSLAAIIFNFLTGRGFVLVVALSGTYLSLGRAIGPGLLVLAAWALYEERRPWMRLLLAGLGVFYLGLLLAIGGRAPLIAAILASFVLLIGARPRLGRTPRQLLTQLVIIIAIGLVTAGVVQLVASRPLGDLPTAVSRIAVLFEQGIRENPRFQHYSRTLHYVDNNPWLGQGIGSWPVVVGYGDIRSYPHNILLEIWFELGLPGLALFGALIAVAVAGLAPWRRLRKCPWALLALALFANALINASVSGDLNDNRLLFVSMGLLLLAETAYRHQAQQEAAPLVGRKVTAATGSNWPA